MERVGTGQNPDQTQANLGVYGGTYSWEYNTDTDLEWKKNLLKK